MSNRLLNDAWKTRGLSKAEKLVLLRLADRADNNGICFPGHKSIAADCGLSERIIQDIIPALQAKGHLTVQQESHRATKDDSKFTYVVHPLTPEAASAATPERASGVTPEVGAADTGSSGVRHRKLAAATPEVGASAIYSEPPITVSNPQGTRLSPSEMILRQRELERAEAAMKNIRDGYDSHQSWSEDDRVKFRNLKTRREELKQLLGMVV